MENPTEYEKTTVENAYNPDVVSLLKAQLDAQREMARILMRVAWHLQSSLRKFRDTHTNLVNYGFR